MNLAFFIFRVAMAPLVATVVALMAWYMWLQEELMSACAEYSE